MGLHFSIVFGNYIMRLFLVTLFSNLHILCNLTWAIRVRSFRAAGCLGQVLQRNWKNTMITSSGRHFIMLQFKIFVIGESENRLSVWQVSSLSVVWIKFYGGWYKTPKKHHCGVIVTSLLNIGFSKQHILYNIK